MNNRIFLKRAPIAKQASEYILREFLHDISAYDVICGYRADDSYFSYAKDFLNNAISLNQLSKAMKLGEQIVLMSPKSFEKICFKEYEIADASIYNPFRQARETRAKRGYLNNHGVDFEIKPENLYVCDILSE